MFEINGKYTTAKVYIDDVEPSCISQIQMMCNAVQFTNPIAVMPDTHYGKGSVIGFTMLMTDKISPAVIGVDIGCFSGDTVVPLLDGTQSTLQELEQRTTPFWIYAFDKNTTKKNKIVPGRARCVKTRKHMNLCIVTVSGGHKIKCTLDHKFLMRDGSWEEAQNLQYRDSLMPLYRTYTKEDGYESISHAWGGTAETHKHIASLFLGERPKNCVIHHKDHNQFNNTPENLEYKDKWLHNSEHAKQKGTFKTKKFKQKRLKILKEKGFFDPKYAEKKKQVARANLINYMTERADDFAEVVKGNAERGSKHFSQHNASESMKNRQKLARIRKIVKLCVTQNAAITKEIYEEHRRKFYNYPLYSTALKIISNCGFTTLAEVADDLLFNKVVDETCALNHKVISVEFTDIYEDVYCLQVEKYHNFALAAGVFVHNCGMLAVNIGQGFFKTKNERADVDRKIRKRVAFGQDVQHPENTINMEKEFPWREA